MSGVAITLSSGGSDACKAAIEYRLALGDDPQARTFVHARFGQVLREGQLPDRQPPEDDSGIAIAVLPSGNWAGFATYYETTDGRLWLDVLWVEPACRRRGVGRQLLDAVRQAAQAGNLKGVALGHAEHNAAMVALMQRAGWGVDHVVRSIPARNPLQQMET